MGIKSTYEKINSLEDTNGMYLLEKNYTYYEGFKVLNIEQDEDEAEILNTKGLIFTSSLFNISVEHLKSKFDGIDSFKDSINFILQNCEFNDIYSLNDIVIVLSSEIFLKETFTDAYKPNQVYFAIIDEDFLSTLY